MHKFQASPFYKVECPEHAVSIKFDYFGEFHTKDEVEVECLLSLAPYVKCVEAPKPKQEKKEKEEVKEEPKKEVKAEEKSKKKPSAK